VRHLLPDIGVKRRAINLLGAEVQHEGIIGVIVESTSIASSR
jgi:hypothetical protein